MSALAFCALHGIAYNRDLDPACPQCVIGKVSAPVVQLEFLGVDPADKRTPVLGNVIPLHTTTPIVSG